MVNVKDLMVGNWIKIPDRLIEVSNVLKGDIIGKDGAMIYIHKDKNLQGIPVTEELLKKIGFEEYEDLPLEGTFYRYWDKDYKYKLDVRNFWTNSKREWYVHIDNDVCNTIGSGEFDYIHELQNLVRVITGHSLPITKEVFYGLGYES